MILVEKWVSKFKLRQILAMKKTTLTFLICLLFWNLHLSARPLVIHQPEINFPLELSADTIHGGIVRALLTIGSDGEVMDVIVLATTHPAFAREAKRVLPTWRYEKQEGPATVDGGWYSWPRSDLVEIEITRSGAAIAQTQFDATRNLFNRSARLPSWDELIKLGQAETLRPVRGKVPRREGSPGERDTVTVEFFLNNEGKAVAPIVTARKPELAEAVARLAQEWEFAPVEMSPGQSYVRQQIILR
jgi:hypothetical protein